jgi:hypothetical protein
MKTFAGDLHAESGGAKVAKFLVCVSYGLLFTLIAIAAIVGLGSMSSVARKLEDNPRRYANLTARGAAEAGVSAAINHIQCHSYREAGALPPSSFAEGGQFRVIWGKPNLEDSTVKITSFGSCQEDGELLAEASIDTVAHLGFFAPEKKAKMADYYSSRLTRIW